MSKLFSIDVRLYATAYIKAETEAAALEIAKGLSGSCLEMHEDMDAELPISGKDFESEDLPDVSLSPAMTVHGPNEDAEPDEV